MEPTAGIHYGWCPVCHGVFMDRMSLPDERKEKAEYLIHNNDVSDPRYRNFVRPLVDLISAEHGQSTGGLDFGAGTGPVITRMLNEQGYSMNLWDPFFHPDEAPLQQKYGFIVACEVVEHFHHPHSSFQLLSRLLADGGSLYCRTSLLDGKTDFARWRYRQDITHVFFYSEHTVNWIARNILKCSCTIHDRNIFSFSRKE